MATVYKLEVNVVSAFTAYNKEQMAEIVKEALKAYVDPVTGLKLESIEVEVICMR
jgi:hypothetical protein